MLRIFFSVLFIYSSQFSYAHESNLPKDQIELCQGCSGNKANFPLDVEEFFSCEKIYISPANLVFDANSIYVTLPGGAIKTSAIFSDVKGLYFKDFKRQGVCSTDEWECSNCHNCNKKWYIWCTVCLQ